MNPLEGVDPSDIINIVLCILSFILAAISVVTVIVTLRQNHKMIENSTRPYVVITAQTTNFQMSMLYIVLKNYGTSGATIKQLDFDIDLQKYSKIPQIAPFDHIKDLFLAPGQALSSVLNSEKMNQDNIKVFNATVTYSDGIHEYKETYPFNFDGFVHNVSYKATTKDEELRTISFALQELVEKQF